MFGSIQLELLTRFLSARNNVLTSVSVEIKFLTKANMTHQQMNFCHKFCLAICTRPYNFSHGLQVSEVSTLGVDTAWLFLSTDVARRDVSKYKAYNSLEDKQTMKSAY